MFKPTRIAAAFIAAALIATPAFFSTAHAEITIGVSISGSGPGASLGIPIRNTFGIIPKTIAGQPVKVVMLDDASDPAEGAKIARRFGTEDKVDVIVGSSTIPVAGAQSIVANELRTAFIALCPIAIELPKQAYSFTVPQPAALVIEAAVEDMKARGIKTIAFIGFSDAWGDIVLRALTPAATAAGIKILTNERFARTDTTVTAQVLKMLAANPDAVFAGDAGTPAVLPHITLTERGFKGRIYHSHGVVVPDFIRVGGKGVEGAIAPSGPIVVADQLPDSNPLKAVATDLIKRYDAAYGSGGRNAFVGYAWDSIAIIQAAAPVALKKAKPGTPEFRQAMRDAIEGLKEVAGTHAVYNMSPTDHNGVDKRGRVLIQVENGQWRLLK